MLIGCWNFSKKVKAFYVGILGHRRTYWAKYVEQLAGRVGVLNVLEVRIQHGVETHLEALIRFGREVSY